MEQHKSNCKKQKRTKIKQIKRQLVPSTVLKSIFKKINPKITVYWNYKNFEKGSFKNNLRKRLLYINDRKSFENIYLYLFETTFSL